MYRGSAGNVAFTRLVHEHCGRISTVQPVVTDDDIVNDIIKDMAKDNRRFVKLTRNHSTGVGYNAELANDTSIRSYCVTKVREILDPSVVDELKTLKAKAKAEAKEQSTEECCRCCSSAGICTAEVL
jgi:hypothetical protein